MKKSLLIVLLLSLVFSLFAGGNAEVIPEVAAGPVVVTDQLGRTVTIEKEPQRIVSGYYISSSACIAMGLSDKIVGIEAQGNKRPIYKLARPEMIKLPNVGTAKAFDLETCLSLNPDLVILPAKQKDTANTLTKMGIPALVVNPESHEQLIEMFSLIGTACNCKAEADKLIKYYSDKLASVESRLAGISKKPVVYMGGTGSYLTTAPKDMYQGSLIEKAGGKNAGDSINGSSWKEISYEQLLSMNPDIIVIPTNSNANGTPDYTVQDILNDKNLQDVKAVKNKKVYQMPVGFEAWDSPVPSGIMGTIWMLKTVHPESYSEKEFANEVKNFYKEFYGFDADL